MKKILFSLMLICTVVKTFSQTAFTLSGKITGSATGWVKFTYTGADGQLVIDSASLQHGTFSFSGNISGGMHATISAYEHRSQDVPMTREIFIEPGNMTLEGTYGDPDNLKLSGSKSQPEYAALEAKLNEINKELDVVASGLRYANEKYNDAIKTGKSDKVLDSLNTKLTAAKKLLEPFSSRYENIVHDFVAAHPGSYVSAYEMGVYTSMWPIDSVKMLFNNFTPAVQYSYYGRKIQAQIASIDSKSANTPAPDFTAADLNGKKLTLSNFKGKYVLLDFWASWCLPCRESNPHLIELYKKYNKAGFDVIAVAEDDDAINSWKKAIQKDGTALWHNVLAGRENNKSSPNSITSKFSIGALPTKILIDKNGTIVGRYMEADEKAMDEKLAAIFGD